MSARRCENCLWCYDSMVGLRCKVDGIDATRTILPPSCDRWSSAVVERETTDRVDLACQDYLMMRVRKIGADLVLVDFDHPETSLSAYLDAAAARAVVAVLTRTFPEIDHAR